MVAFREDHYACPSRRLDDALVRAAVRPRAEPGGTGDAAAGLLRKLDRPVQARLVAVSRPIPLAGVKALAGHPGLPRIRVGTYRIAYTVRDQELILLVACHGHRSDVYDTL